MTAKNFVTQLSAWSLEHKAKFLGAAYALGATAYEEDPEAKKPFKLSITIPF